MVLEEIIDNLTQAVQALTAVMSAASQVSTQQPIAPPAAQQPVQQPVAPVAQQPVAPVAQQPVVPVAQQPVQQPAGAGPVTVESLKAKASGIARQLGPRAAELSAELQRLGTLQLSGLDPSRFAEYDQFLDGKILELNQNG